MKKGLIVSEPKAAIYQMKEDFEASLKSSIEDLSENNLLRDACEYALLNGGKRIRPIIIKCIAQQLYDGEQVMLASLAVEYFHTASLIADDLPCMDNDFFRRDQPSLHIAFDETTALLASYGLISEAYRKIHQASEAMGAPQASLVCYHAVAEASRCSGLQGATTGQFYDLQEQVLSEAFIKKVLYLKTVTLFEVAFVFGWLFGGGEPSMIPEFRKMAYHFGMAFQIADDIKDMEQDGLHSNAKNLALVLGKSAAYSLFDEELKAFEEALRSQNLYSSNFGYLVELLQDYASTLPRVS